MFPGCQNFLKIAVLLTGAAAPLLGGTFAPPAEGPVPFRRDRLPLDADTMRSLSAQLTALADGTTGETAAARRCAAQMLALSVAIDPANTRARTLLEQFETDQHQPVGDGETISKSRARIWQNVGWLETIGAGDDGQALATCLKDVMAVADPKDPRSEALLAKGEHGAWAGWIPDKSAYEEAKVIAQSPDDAPGPPEEKPGILLNKASVLVPLWKQQKNSNPAKWELVLAPLNMTARWTSEAEGEQGPFAIVIGNPNQDGQFVPLAASILKALGKQHGNLAAGSSVKIDSPELETSASSGKRQSISAAAAVLASAAISGRDPDAAIIGVIDGKGDFKLPTDFWNQLRSMSGGTGKRLILPAAAADSLPSMLALENPQFFLDHEVLLAANFQQLLDYSAKSPDDSLKKVIAQFQEIRDKAGSQPLGQYVANSFVRRRLAEIAQTAPFHFSAKMLAIQGAGSRPAYISREVLVSELQRSIAPMKWLIKHDQNQFQANELELIGTTFESCRSEVDLLIRYTEKADRGLVDQVLDMVSQIRTLDRAARVRPDPNNPNVNNGVQSALSALKKSDAAVAVALGTLPAGNPPPPGS